MPAMAKYAPTTCVQQSPNNPSANATGFALVSGEGTSGNLGIKKAQVA